MNLIFKTKMTKKSQNSWTDAPEIQKLVDQLLAAKGLTQLNKIEQEIARDQLLEMVDETITATIVGKLSAGQRQQFEKLLDQSADAAALQKFVQTSIPNLDQLLPTALVEMSKIYLSA